MGSIMDEVMDDYENRFSKNEMEDVVETVRKVVHNNARYSGQDSEYEAFILGKPKDPAYGSTYMVSEEFKRANPHIFPMENWTEIDAERASKKKWDLRFLTLASTVAQWSKDPSRKVGAVIVRDDKSIVSLGYNGFARGVADCIERYQERETKYELVVHAEVNAILSAQQNLKGTTLYSTLLPCSRCAAIIINAGIIRVVYLGEQVERSNAQLHFDLTQLQFEEAQLEVVGYNKLTV